MRTRAAVLYQANEPMRIEELELAEPKEREVLVRIAASGVCRSDWHVINGDWQRGTALPMVLGHEASGTVEQVGPGVTTVKPGDPVVVNFAPFCGQCNFCLSGRPVLCTAVRSATPGAMPDGTTRLSRHGQPIHHFAASATFAEHAVLHESGAIKVRPDVPLGTAALVGCAVMTGVGAVVNTAKVQAGSSVAVFGAGGVGLNVIQGARLAGASQIIAVDIVDEKLEFARQHGATDVINAKSEDPVRAVRRRTGGGADYTFEVLGSGPLIRQAFDAAKRGGKVVVVGLPADGVDAAVDASALVFGEKVLMGCFYGSTRARIDMPRLIDMCLNGQLQLSSQVTRHYRLDQINEAYDDLVSGKPGRGLIVMA